MVSAIFGTILLKNETSGFFIFGNITGIKNSLNQANANHLYLSKYTPGYDIWFYILSEILGAPLDSIVYIPVGILICPIIYLAFSKKLFGSYFFAALLSAYLVFDAAQTGWHNTFAYSWTRPIYISSLILIISIFDSKTAEKIFALIILFFGAILIHYTVPVWIIIFIASMYLFSKMKMTDSGAAIGWALLLSFCVIYISTNKIFYDIYIPKFRTLIEGGYYDTISIFLTKIKSYIFTSVNTIDSHRYYPDRGIYDAIRIILNFVLFAPLCILLPILIKKISTKAENKKKSIYTSMCIAILITGVIHAIIYGTITGISNQILLFMGPIAIVSSFYALMPNVGKITAIFLILIVLLSGASAILSIDHQENQLDYSYSKPSAKWLFEYESHQKHYFIEERPIVLMPISYGYYANYVGVDFNKSLSPVYFNNETYEMLISNNYFNLKGYFDYLLVDKYSYYQYVSGETAKYFKPISYFSSEFENNTNLHRIYDMGPFSIHRT